MPHGPLHRLVSELSTGSQSLRARKLSIHLIREPPPPPQASSRSFQMDGHELILKYLSWRAFLTSSALLGAPGSSSFAVPLSLSPSSHPWKHETHPIVHSMDWFNFFHCFLYDIHSNFSLIFKAKIVNWHKHFLRTAYINLSSFFFFFLAIWRFPPILTKPSYGEEYFNPQQAFGYPVPLDFKYITSFLTSNQEGTLLISKTIGELLLICQS